MTIIRAGRAVQSGTLAQLQHLTRNELTAVTARDPAGLATVDGVHDLVVGGERVRLTVDNAHLDVVLEALVGLGVRGLTSAPPSLEELFLREYGDVAVGAGAR